MWDRSCQKVCRTSKLFFRAHNLVVMKRRETYYAKRVSKSRWNIVPVQKSRKWGERRAQWKGVVASCTRSQCSWLQESSFAPAAEMWGSDLRGQEFYLVVFHSPQLKLAVPPLWTYEFVSDFEWTTCRIWNARADRSGATLWDTPWHCHFGPPQVLNRNC